MSSFHEMTSAIEADRTAMRDLLAALVAIPTENLPATGYAPCIALIESTLRQLEFPFERLEIASPAGAPRAAIRAWLGDASPAVCFHGHYDVVPAASRDQFVPRVEGDTVFGRGSSDMKSGLGSMLFAAKALRSAGGPLSGRVDAGSNFNVVPAACRFTLDRRTNPEEDFAEARRRLLDIFDDARAGGVDVEVRTIQEGRSSSTSQDNPLAGALAGSVADVTG